MTLLYLLYGNRGVSLTGKLKILVYLNIFLILVYLPHLVIVYVKQRGKGYMLKPYQMMPRSKKKYQQHQEGGFLSPANRNGSQDNV